MISIIKSFFKRIKVKEEEQVEIEMMLDDLQTTKQQIFDETCRFKRKSKQEYDELIEEMITADEDLEKELKQKIKYLYNFTNQAKADNRDELKKMRLEIQEIKKLVEEST